MRTKYADSCRSLRAVFPHIEKEESWTELNTLREAKQETGQRPRNLPVPSRQAEDGEMSGDSDEAWERKYVFRA